MKQLGLDWGERRIGVAIGSNCLALPFDVFPMNDSLVSRLETLCEQEEIDLVVTGRPLASDGTTDRVSARWAGIANAFGAWCAEKSIPVVVMDERYTSAYAQAAMSHRPGAPRGDISNTRSDGHRMIVDAVAAARLLQDYLDSQG